MLNHPDRPFPGDPAIRAIARDLFAGAKNLPLVWFADEERFADLVRLLVVPDHAEHFCLCRGTPTRWWLDHAIENPSGIESPLDPTTVSRRPGSDRGCDGPKRTDKIAALSPFAGGHPRPRLGPPSRLHDSLDGLEEAGFCNKVGFNDDRDEADKAARPPADDLVMEACRL